MSWSARKAYRFVVLFLILHVTEPQVVNSVRAREKTLKYLVHIRPNFRADNNVHTAAGTILKLDLVLTCAHCVQVRGKDLEDLTIKAGTKHLNDGENMQIIYLNREELQGAIIPHHDYNPLDNSDSFDVALIRLPASKKFEYDAQHVVPANLLTRDMGIPDDYVRCVVQGWGESERGRYYDDFNDEFYMAFVDALDPDQAKHGEMNLLEKRGLLFRFGCRQGQCASAGKGDSGAPIVCALRANEDPMQNGKVFAVAASVSRDVSRLGTPAGHTTGNDVREIEEWIRGHTGESARPAQQKMARRARRAVEDSSATTVIIATIVIAVAVACLIARWFGYL